MSGLIPQDYYWLEGSSLVEGVVQFNYEKRATMIEQTVDTFDYLLLGHIQIYQRNDTSLFNTLKQGFIMPDEIFALGAVLTQQIRKICLRREEYLFS